MNRKLIALNAVLALVVGWAGYLLRNEIVAAKAREAKMRNARVQTPPMAPLPALPNQPAVLATTYKDVAMKTLFHPSRNPDLPPPPVEAPPPPKPMPALPRYIGTMNLGDGPKALLAIGGGPSQLVKPGDTIGPFKLVDVNTVDITFEWEGQIARRTLDQMTDRKIETASNDDRSVQVAAPAAAAAPVVKTPVGPGETTQFGFRTCDPNDSLPDGTVKDGFRKVSYKTPFGSACRWDPLGR